MSTAECTKERILYQLDWIARFLENESTGSAHTWADKIDAVYEAGMHDGYAYAASLIRILIDMEREEENK